MFTNKSININQLGEETTLSKGSSLSLFPITLHSVYKGEREEKEKIEKLKKSYDEKKEMMVRGHERILLGTNVRLDQVSDMSKLKIEPEVSISIEKGFSITAITIIDGEIMICLYNGSPHLCSLNQQTSIGTLIYEG